MLSDIEIVQMCADIYSDTQAPYWNFYDCGPGDHDICYGIRREGDTDYVIFRGSKVFLDWFRDGDWWSRPTVDPRLGEIWPGFVVDMDAAWTEIQHHVGAKVVVGGHSLGAARASVLAGYMLVDGCKPLARICFGEPNTGFPKFCNFVSQVPGRTYKNFGDLGHDHVTDVPYNIPIIAPYGKPPTKLNVTATPGGPEIEQLGFFSYHHINLYVKGMQSYVEGGHA